MLSTIGVTVTTELTQALRRAGVGDVLSDGLSRAAYSSDASLYRLVPQVVVRPHERDEVLATLAVCRDAGVPLVARGGGTSIAGNSIGEGVVIDFSRYMNRVLEFDASAGAAVVQPGTVHATLQKQALAEGWRFGPDPSSHSRCTVGGMVGNNACGSRALGYGRTSDNVLALESVTAAGEVLRTRHGEDRADVVAASPVWAGLDAIAQRHLGVIRPEFARFGRQVSGYAAEHLLPENGFDVSRFLVGSEGTLTVLTEATMRLVREPSHRVLVVLGYADIYDAGDAAPSVLEFSPIAAEGLDKRIVDILTARRGPSAVPDLPRGEGWLFVEIAGDDRAEVIARAHRVADGCGALDSAVIEDLAVAATLWRVREDGAGLSSRSARDRPAHAGWEDAAVPPGRLGAYLREFDELMSAHDLTGLPYGHFGDGCLHIRIDFPLDRPDGMQGYSEFIDASADLVAKYEGSFSGEHGDGRARSGLLPKMYSPEVIALFGEVKRHFDPAGLLNPGVLVDPAAPTDYLRIPAAGRVSEPLALKYLHDGGDFAQAVHRCTGVGKCRADNSAAGGVMCPSYLATGEEKDSTRGRARVLQEMVNGSLVHGWSSPEVHDALDLCLSCKGCASDCPTGIDMASYKAEVLHQTYRHKPRPRSHYALGQLPRWVRLGGRMPKIANVMLGLGDRVGAFKRLAGVDPRRSLPELAPVTFRQWCSTHGVKTVEESDGQPDRVLLLTDTFTNHFSPEIGQAAVRVLRDAGLEPVITSRDGCCGLTWITTGQLDAARRILGKTLDDLEPAVRQGIPIVGLEPSCTAVYRSDALELLGEERAGGVARHTKTLAELLTGLDSWSPPDLSDERLTAQPHCHHHAVLGWSADAQLLKDAGADVTRLAGCCGLAGNFGVEEGHYDVSVKVAEHQLLPALRADPDATLLADGFSCRTQAEDLADRKGVHLAQILDPLHREVT
ncbi:FAD-binding oxidoreductase [Leekyejoonella antrihumi]|uniref:FAD-binding oxidoreductase n=1 Tax=Leekyejoonella antrihumi TaxID=1660198 RepID=A0A563DXA1_9MICO|nr:FAD-binding and (Fe-S)-binding domain-containing protein [Leekyejoonella antrihumi]TWP34563.1 FAD-binding oxidoreductase [Leekyejoonella antrihumi]